LTSSYSTVYETDASNARYQVTKSIVERYDLSIPPENGVKGVDGRDYSWFGLGSSLLAVPFYVIGKYFNTPENTVSIMNLLVGSATAVLVFMFAIALGYDNRSSVLISIFYGIASFAWPLVKQPFDHTVETFFVLLSVYSIYLYTLNHSSRFLFLSAFGLGFAFITRLSTILVLPSIFIILTNGHVKKTEGLKISFKHIIKDIVLFSLIFIPFLCLNGWYNHYRFGSFFETGYALIASRTGINFFSGTPLFTGLSGLIASPGKGFFFYSPIAILFFFAFKSFLKKYPALTSAFIVLITSHLIIISKNIYWHGDWAWGPRYLLVLTPFFIIPIAELLHSQKGKKRLLIKVSVSSIFLISLLIQLAAISVNFQRYFFYLIFEERANFSVVIGTGVQQIAEPLPELYFKWHYSPILVQLDSIYKIGKNLKDYKYSEAPDTASISEKFRAAPSHNVYDFWWLYRYYIENSFLGFLIALLLLLFTIHTLVRLRNLTRI
jgi:hypothetical protein